MRTEDRSRGVHSILLYRLACSPVFGKCLTAFVHSAMSNTKRVHRWPADIVLIREVVGRFFPSPRVLFAEGRHSLVQGGNVHV